MDRIVKTSTLDRMVFVFTIRSIQARRPDSQADPSNRLLQLRSTSVALFLRV